MTHEVRVVRIERILSQRLWTMAECEDIHRRFTAGADTLALASAYGVHESEIVRALDQWRSMGRKP